jgi:hypothetical protein
MIGMSGSTGIPFFPWQLMQSPIVSSSSAASAGQDADSTRISEKADSEIIPVFERNLAAIAIAITFLERSI